MFWKILIIFSTISSIFMYLIILGANKCKTPEEREEEDFLQMLELSKLRKKKGTKNEKVDNSGETECFKRISENIRKMYED